MDTIKGRAMFKGFGILPFLPGIFYDVDLTLRNGQIVVSAPPPEGIDEPLEASYSTINDMLEDWAFSAPGDPTATEWDTPYDNDYAHYRWTLCTKQLAEAYTKSVMAVNKAIAQCDSITCGNEETYLYRTREALRSIRKEMGKVTIKPKK